MPTTKTQGSQINKIQIFKKNYIYRAETDSQKRQNKLVVTTEGRREGYPSITCLCSALYLWDSSVVLCVAKFIFTVLRVFILLMNVIIHPFSRWVARLLFLLSPSVINIPLSVSFPRPFPRGFTRRVLPNGLWKLPLVLIMYRAATCPPSPGSHLLPRGSA